MDVTKSNTLKKKTAGKGGRIDGKQRRALARLGLASAGAYVAPTLLALQSTAMNPKTGVGIAA